MKTLLLAALPALCVACVTPGDLQRITYKLEELDTVANDANASAEDFAEKLHETKDEVSAVAKEALARAEDLGNTALTGTQGGLVGLGSSILLYVIREITRKKALAQVAAAKPPA